MPFSWNSARFISFFANNGTRSTAEVRTLANSCASTLRYHEGRDDFSFLKSSRVRLGYYDGEVILEVRLYGGRGRGAGVNALYHYNM